jgi:hypothetical protein
MVTIDNYEEYMMLDADGELDSAGRQALQNFLAANPALKEELAIWQSVKLQPEEMLVYPDQEALKKVEPKAVVLNIRPYVFAAAAAILAAVILIPFLWKHDNGGQRMAQSGTPVKVIAPVVDINSDSNHDEPAPASSANSKPRRTPTHNSTMPRIARSTAASKESGIRTEVKTESVAVLNAAATRTLPAATPASAPDLQRQDVAFAMAEEAPKHHASGLPRITFAPENQAAFNQLKSAFESRVAQASAAVRSVKETALEIKVGQGAFNLNF